MLGLQIDTPFHRVVKLLTAVLQHSDGIGVVDLGKVGADKLLKAGDGLFIDVLGKKLQIITAFIQHGAEHILEHLFGQLGIGFQIVERDFRFDHPELGQVTAGVGVFGTEGWPEGINLGEGTGIGLGVELTGNGEE